MKIIDACDIWNLPEYKFENQIRQNDWQIGFWDGVNDVFERMKEARTIGTGEIVAIGKDEYDTLVVLWKIFDRQEKENRGKNDMMAQMFAAFRDILGDIIGKDKDIDI